MSAYIFDPYITADDDALEADLDWSEFDPAAGTGSALVTASPVADIDIDGNPEGLLSDFYNFDPYVA